MNCFNFKPPKSRIVFFAVTISILTTIFIGIRYGNSIFINIVPVLFWLWAILVCFIALYSNQESTQSNFKYSNTWVGLTVLLIVAFFLRIITLSTLPPGLHGDEASYIDFSLLHVFNPAIPEGTINPFRTGSDSHPILYSYILYFSSALFGYSTAGVRVSSAIAGTLAIGAVFLMMKEIASSRMAWLTAILMTVYHYHIHWSRVALNNIWTTLLIPLVLGFFMNGWHKGKTSGALLAGLFLGFSAYFYSGGYIIVLLLLIVILQEWKKSGEKNQLFIYIGKMLTMAIVVAAPLILFAILYPQHFFDRANVVYGWSPAAIADMAGTSTSYWKYFVYQVTRSFGAYNYFIDVTGFYNPSIPFLIGVSSILFLVGIFQAFQKRQYLPILWMLIVTILGGVMLAGTPASSHFIAVIPALCWLVAIPLDSLMEKNKSHWAYLLLALIIIIDLWFYFGIYSSNPSKDFTLPFPR